MHTDQQKNLALIQVRLEPGRHLLKLGNRQMVGDSQIMVIAMLMNSAWNPLPIFTSCQWYSLHGIV
jgi:hypothetical protein